ncbi:MAG: efflux RND transporter permease subunit, partial [Desulfovibrio sp.]|nr:efflux RND transporter permease subunit [Desulfovibrio sp.]
SIAELREWGTRLKEEIAKSRVVADVDSDLEEHGLETYVTADRDRMAHYGVTMQAFDNALGLAFGQTQVSTIYKDRNQYKVVLGFDEPWLQAPESLQEVRIPGRDGLVPLTSVAEIGFGFSSLAVAHQGQFAAVTISFNLASGHSISEAQAVIEEAGIRIGMPETVFGSFQGSAKLFADTVKTELLLILAAIVTLYIVLGVLYESLIHPVTILSTLPPAGGGALIALMIFGMQFSVIALIGVLLLCGLVKKNAILVIDFALTAQRTQRLAPDEAIVEACRLRFRPIMMTTFAAMFGAVPLALGQGDGAELRQPLGVAIVGGLALSQLLTLYTTPVVFLYLDSLRRRFRAWYLSLKYGARKAKLIMAFSGPRP